MAQAPTELTGDQLRRLRETFAGDIVVPTDAAYDGARRLWNAVHDRRPAVIARPSTSAEVASLIRFAREHDLELAVRSGGHSPAGHSTCDGGLVVDLSRMRGVSVDPATRTARANGGALTPDASGYDLTPDARSGHDRRDGDRSAAGRAAG